MKIKVELTPPKEVVVTPAAEDRRAWCLEMAVVALTKSEHNHDVPLSVVDLAEEIEEWVSTGARSNKQ